MTRGALVIIVAFLIIMLLNNTPAAPLSRKGDAHQGQVSVIAPAGTTVRGNGPKQIPETDGNPGGLRFSPGVRLALNLLRMHESANGTRMIGDGGKARGWLQQHEDHWREGCEQLGVSWKWPEDTGDLAKCEMVAVGYWKRYAPEHLAAGNVEELVRRFRLPFAPYRADNDAYWAKCKEKMP